MKASEKIQLMLKGTKMEDIKALEEQEEKEAAEEAARLQEEEKKEEEKENTALEAALNLVNELESKLETKEDELTKLNNEFVKLTNKQTIIEEPDNYSASDVMKELFHPNKTKEV